MCVESKMYRKKCISEHDFAIIAHITFIAYVVQISFVFRVTWNERYLLGRRCCPLKNVLCKYRLGNAVSGDICYWFYYQRKGVKFVVCKFFARALLARFNLAYLRFRDGYLLPFLGFLDIINALQMPFRKFSEPNLVQTSCLYSWDIPSLEKQKEIVLGIQQYFNVKL